MNGITAAAPIGGTRFVIVVKIGVVICRDDFSIHAIVTSAIASRLRGQRAIGYICIDTSAIGLTLVDSAWILVVAIGGGGADVALFGWLSSVRIECARRNLGGRPSKNKNSGKSREKARTKRHC